MSVTTFGTPRAFGLGNYSVDRYGVYSGVLQVSGATTSISWAVSTAFNRIRGYQALLTSIAFSATGAPTTIPAFAAATSIQFSLNGGMYRISTALAQTSIAFGLQVAFILTWDVGDPCKPGNWNPYMPPWGGWQDWAEAA